MRDRGGVGEGEVAKASNLSVSSLISFNSPEIILKY